jgi:predicted ABC-type transport system involved in lysophospholipase L1 biosynthesis ATPase subunit
VTLREVAQGAAMEHAYQVRLGDHKHRVALVRALETLPGVQDVSLLLQEPTVEL